MRLRLLTLGTLLAATPALAGGPGPVIVEPAPVVPVVVAPQVADWSGFYAGLGYGKAIGSLDDGTSTDFEDGTGVSGFVGYNWQSGNVVYGGELAYTGLNDMTLTGAPDTKLNNAVDLKARVGYAAGRVMPYLSLGYSMAKLDVGGTSSDLTGVSYGLGVDYLVTDNVFIGADYTKRELSGDGYDADPSTFGLRIGYKF